MHFDIINHLGVRTLKLTKKVIAIVWVQYYQFRRYLRFNIHSRFLSTVHFGQIF